MSKFKFFSVAFLAMGYTAVAQDVEAAKKAIDAEQFEKAKSILKSVIKAKPDNGRAVFLLGNVYLQQTYQDSAKAAFQSGITLKEAGLLNYIGLGQIDLDNGNASAAQFNFDQALKEVTKKNVEPQVYVGKAFTKSEKPDAKKAIEVLLKAKAVSPNDAQLQMALGDAYYLDVIQNKSTTSQNEAYAAYRNAVTNDASLVRAKMQQSVLLKGARAYQQAKEGLDQIIAANPTYGPAYRELAETYLGMALSQNDKAKFKEYTEKALPLYEKYMSLTDYSLASRMRHADFLIITQDYKALEKEAEEMKKLDKVNPRILRYLGYAAYENGNIDNSIDVLNQYVGNSSNKIIGRDYLYLGLGQIKKAVVPAATATDKPKVDDALFDAAIANFKKAVDLDKPMANDLNEIGKGLFDQKLYKQAAAVYEVAVGNPNSKNYLYDNFYLGFALYFQNTGLKAGEKVNVEELKKADAALAIVLEKSATTQEAHIYRARVNSLIDTDPTAQAQMAKSYEDYINVVTAKGEAEVAKSKAKFIEAYQNLALYNKKDKVKATDYINKALAIDPADADSLKIKAALK